ncbi:hypothetical protein [Massilia phyllosphaerae]|uniref:hypothetical protein n=1 Tax=Massilia phyllosphaerae TaxID=3106034 RepID=UPI002B1CDB06|nr:hypothetical protein [Massilia sp. SGZ-792]
MLSLLCPASAAHAYDDALQARQDAETRAAIAAAERAELLARLPPATSKPLSGAVELRQFGAAGLVKAFDLARQLAGDVCSALPADRKTSVYEPGATQGILAARLVQDAIERFGDDLGRQNKLLQQAIDAHAPQGSKAGLILPALSAVPATLRAAADLSALFKTDVGVEGLAYGEGARSLFVTALARQCPDKVAGLGAGYLGELDAKPYDSLLAKVRSLATQRGELANRTALVQRLADAAKGDEKKELAALAAVGGTLLKSADAFIDSLRAGETGERSPLFNAARYLGYAARTRDMLVLDFDLRLEGMTIVKDNLFSGQRLRLAGVAFLWYRLHEPNGALRLADTVRRMTAPVEVDLRGDAVGGAFWGGTEQARK